MPTNNDADMTAPLTRRDLEEVLDQRLATYPTKDDLKEVLDQRLANYPTKDDLKEVLDQRLANYPTKDDLKNALENYPTRDELKNEFATFRKLINEDFQVAIRVVSEENRAWFRTVDDKYKDLPERVHKLEEAVFPPPPRSRRRKSG
jgi:hypothetical protein